MIGVERHRLVGEIDHRHADRLAFLGRAGHPQALLEGDVAGKLILGQREDKVLAARAIAVLGGNGHGLGLARCHADDGVLETGDHLMLAEFEGDRVTAARTIEFLAALERAGVVDPDRIAGIRSAQHFSPVAG